MSYSRVLAHYPYVILVVVSIFAITCLVVVMALADFPDFHDPKLGFEARGTDLSNRLRSHALLLEKTVNNRPGAPSIIQPQLSERNTDNFPQTSSADDGDDEDDDGDESDYDVMRNHTGPHEFFCGDPMKEYARIVFRAKDGSNLFTLDNLKSMCDLEELHIRALPEFASSCVHISQHNRHCCRSWSLGNYVAMLSNRSSCSSITIADVERTRHLLEDCSKFYRNQQLLSDCHQDYLTESETRCPKVPKRCTNKNAVYHILHYILDIRYMKQELRELNNNVTFAMTYLPIAAGLGMEGLYEASQGALLQDENVEVVATQFGLKHILFDKYLRRDTLWSVVALVAIFICMWVYTASLFITIMTVISLFLTLEITYFLYTLVFEIPLFPFMNLMTIVILIGIGADDVFIYCKVWRTAKHEKNAGTLEKLVSDTLRHASLSMFVTSLTTAAAFYANYLSDIPALSCFALFAGTAVVINFLIMVTWIPGVIVIHEKWCSDCCMCYSPDFYTTKSGCAYYLCNIPYKIYTTFAEWSRIFFEKFLPWFVIKLRYVWLSVFGLLAVAALIIVFYYPKLQLPSSNDFQMFAQSHPFEVYDFKIKDSFWFEKEAREHVATMPLSVVWGVEASDTGNHLDPYDEGDIVFSKDFNVATPEAQMWLVRFCREFRKSAYYQHQPGLQLSNCFIEHFRLFMERGCEGANGERLECCRNAGEFPFPEPVFRKCINVYLPLLEQSSHLYPGFQNAGLRYSKDTQQLVGLIVEFNANMPFSFSYTDMRHFYSTMNSFVKKQLASAPPGMRRGWFVSYLNFYDLQDSIAHGTPIAIGVSLAIATLVAFLTTLNVLITFYAMISIAAAIFVTVASLVVLGWELNILESVTISVAVGLSVDFSLHYGMAYRLSPDLDREKRVICATARMSSPVSMACFTTFVAGAIMLPSTVLVYRQLAIFLMLVMPISWTYSTLFFQSLLRVAGPQGGFGQFRWPTCNCRSSSPHCRVDKTVYTMSESTVSTSGTNIGTSSETHELEPLADHNGHFYSHHHHHHHHHHHRPRGYRVPSPRQTTIDSMDTEVSFANDTVVSLHAELPKVTVNNNYNDQETVTTKLLNHSGPDHCSARRSSLPNEIWVKRAEVSL